VNRRSFMFVGNLAAAVSMVLHSPRLAGSFVVSDSDPVSTPEFARRIGAALGRPARVFTFPWIGAELRASLPLDSSRFWHAVGGAPPFTMAEGLRLTTEEMTGPDAA
jgi:nucleoside-diphosphate-sugar epimerase